ncbi:MAG TPA: DUF5694 domain-containing protein [Caulobacteraceae bacterium]|nr:DUF5694 domain-containing protein [Caulobacteraceae bacterium]
MIRFILAALLCAAPSLAASAPPPTPAPVEVMIVGDFHMNNPGRDLHNVAVDDVLEPKRQAQIAAVVHGLARFRPTLVAAEWSAQTVRDRYAAFTAGTLAPSRNEVVQLGFRLARETGAAMEGVDVEGDFPYDAVAVWAAAHGQTPLLDVAGAQVEAFTREITRRLASGGVSDALRFLNDPARIESDNGFYRTMLRVGAGTVQPGADLLTAWYRRNLLICANLIQLTRPGDRMVVFYGSGHAFLLRQCVRETPGFRLVEPNDFLPG